MKILTSVKAESFTKTENTQGITIKPIYEELSGVAYCNVRLVKVNKESGETLVHVSTMGILLEWNRIEALGTIYPVKFSKMREIVKSLEAIDTSCYYYFI